MNPIAHQATLLDYQRASEEWTRHPYPFHLEHEMVAAGPVESEADRRGTIVQRCRSLLVRLRAHVGWPGTAPASPRGQVPELAPPR